MTRRKLGVLAAVLVGALALAGPIKVWTTGSTVSAADLNANMAHLHANLGHGHGAVIVNADISASAGISPSKLATPILVPKATGRVGTATVACTSAGACTYDTSGGLPFSVARGGTAGTYTVTWTTPRLNSVYSAMVTPVFSAVTDIACAVSGITTVDFDVTCFKTSTAAVTDASFSFVVFDDNS